MIIAFAGQKGGAGKSTLAIATACELHARGYRVLLVDADPQGSARTFAAVAAEGGYPSPTVVSMGAEMYRPDQLPQLAPSFDHTIIDTPGRQGTIQKAALMVADLVVLPVGPSPLDVWSLAESAELIREAQALRPDLAAIVTVNRKDPRTVLGRTVRASLEGLGLPILDTEISLRIAMAEAPAAGQGVTAYAPKDAAAEEVRALVSELLGFAAGKESSA